MCHYIYTRKFNSLPAAVSIGAGQLEGSVQMIPIMKIERTDLVKFVLTLKWVIFSANNAKI